MLLGGYGSVALEVVKAEPANMSAAIIIRSRDLFIAIYIAFESLFHGVVIQVKFFDIFP